MTQNVQLPDMGHYEKCRKKMELLDKHHTARFAVMLIFSFSNAMFVLLGGGSLRFMMGGGRNLVAALPFAFLALLLGIVLMLLVTFAKEKRLLLLFAVLLTILGMMLSLLNLWVGIVFLITEISLFLEYKDLDSLKTQEGYPQFHERFTEQKLISEAGCRFDYDLSANTAEMPAVDDTYE